MIFDIQSKLENDNILLDPLKEVDFENLYAVAADPQIWEQHPNKDRWMRDVFKNFFDGAILSKGAYKIIDKSTGSTMGSTRFYDYNELEHSIKIGYTFYATTYWGKGINLAVKSLMLNYIFKFVSTVEFHIGANNLRSQIAISRLGATKIREEDIAYFGEQPKLNSIFQITKEDWYSKHPTSTKT